jgi:hypothetical protein
MPINGDTEMTWEESLYANYTDGMLILHKGEVVMNAISAASKEDGKHAIMSMTKSSPGFWVRSWWPKACSTTRCWCAT